MKTLPICYYTHEVDYVDVKPTSMESMYIQDVFYEMEEVIEQTGMVKVSVES